MIRNVIVYNNMENISEFRTATPESVWAALQESDRQRKENERFLTEKQGEIETIIKEIGKSQAETDRQLKESSADFDRRMKESDARFERQVKEYDRRMKKFEEMNGGLSNNQGLFAEEYFFNSFENGQQNFFGEKFDAIERNIIAQL